MNNKKSRLGRGLDDLVSPKGLDKLLPAPADIRPEAEETEAGFGRPLMVPADLLDYNPDQPRRHFSEKELISLGQSIKAKGIIEPLVVTRKDNGRYEIIAGERRLRAAKMVELEQIPVIIRQYYDDPADRLILALLENLCREDLNPIEEAESFSRLEKEFSRTQQEIAVMTGRERPTITNSMRLLKLPEFAQDDIRYGRLSAGHGRALLALKDPSLLHQLRTEIMTKSLTVRQTEALVKKYNRPPSRKPDLETQDEAYFEALAKSFSNKLGGLKIKIDHSGRNRKMEIYYSSNEELEWLMHKIGVDPV